MEEKQRIIGQISKWLESVRVDGAKCRFRVKTNQGVEVISGTRYGKLVVHPIVVDEGEEDPRWSVSHLPTGYAVVRFVRDQPMAESVACALLKVYDWDFKLVTRRKVPKGLRYLIRFCDLSQRPNLTLQQLKTIQSIISAKRAPKIEEKSTVERVTFGNKL